MTESGLWLKDEINNSTIIVKANLNQLVRDVSQGMAFLKKKYPEKIPTNITTLKIK